MIRPLFVNACPIRRCHVTLTFMYFFAAAAIVEAPDAAPRRRAFSLPVGFSRRRFHASNIAAEPFR